MTAAIDMELARDETDSSAPLVCKVRVNDPELVGHDAEFHLDATVEVKRSDGISSSHTLHWEAFQVQSGETEFQIPASKLRFYSYAGKHVDLRLHTKVWVNDAVVFDTKVSEEQLIRIGAKPPLNSEAAEIIEPKDAFRFFANLKAIPPLNRMITLGLVVVGGLVVLANAAVGVHDQFSPEAATWFYSHQRSNGGFKIPLLTALIGSGALGAGIWFLMRRQLRGYMQLRLAPLPARIERGVDYRVSDLVAGHSRVPLEDVTLRIVAGNLECGQYRKLLGRKAVAVSFQEPMRGVVLYEKTVDRIPARMPIADYFNDRLSFDPMFAALYPPAMLGSSHGIDVRWEVQILHADLVDRKLIGPTEGLAYEDFLGA
ncbi:MAG: hypothetical protein QNJ06_17600 [Kiloniellales bacterium]|nr:hypothetical protein [Kiloniellales bacterium]MDJ0971714.1 hypothetical protein [Kiloniellales bacterium]